MAVNLVPDANFTRTSTGLALPVSACWWAKFDTFPASYQTMLYHGTAVYSNCLLVGALSDSTVSATDGSFASKAATPALSTGVWYFFGVTVNTGTGNFILYWREEGDPSLQSDAGTWAGTFASNRLCWAFAATGDTAANAHDGSMAYCRLFSGVLTEAQMMDESESTTAVATEWADWPMATTANSTTDVSGNSRTLTFNAGSGSQANDTDPDLSVGGGSVTLDGESNAIADVDGSLSVAKALTSKATAIVDLDGTLSSTKPLTGSLGAIAALDGDLDVVTPTIHALDGEINIIADVGFRNRLVPTGTFETGTDTWGPASANLTMERTDEVPAAQGTWSIKNTRITATVGPAQVFSSVAGNAAMTVNPGDVVHVRFAMRSGVTDRTGQILFRWYNAARASLGDNTVNGTVVGVVGEWTYYTITSPAAPANAAFVNPALRTSANIVQDEFVYYDDVSLWLHGANNGLLSVTRGLDGDVDILADVEGGLGQTHALDGQVVAIAHVETTNFKPERNAGLGAVKYPHKRAHRTPGWT